MNTLIKRNTIVPFTEKVEVFGQTLTVVGKAEIEMGDHGRHIGAVWFTSICVGGFSDDLMEVVFTLPLPVKELSHKQLLELENALADQCSERLFETMSTDEELWGDQL